MSAIKAAQDELEAMLKAEFEAGKIELQETTRELAEYTLQRAQHLASIAGEPGYDLALRAEHANLLLRTGIDATRQARAADARVSAILQTTLTLGARLLIAAI